MSKDIRIHVMFTARNNVMRIKESLTNKDLITTSVPHHMELCDPILGLWLRRRVWREERGGIASS